MAREMKNLLQNEEAAIGLPIRMVVLTTIGLIGFAAILGAVNNAPVVQGHIYTVADITSFSIPGETGDTPLIEITALNYENEPVSNANVVIRGPSGYTATSGITDSDGRVRLSLEDIRLPEGKREGYISAKVMASGYMDHSNEYLVKVVRD